jgi:ubiquinone biosynthesis protein Coq4
MDVGNADRIVGELELAMFEASAPYCEQHPATVLLSYAMMMLTREQRKRLGALMATLPAADLSARR